MSTFVTTVNLFELVGNCPPETWLKLPFWISGLTSFVCSGSLATTFSPVFLNDGAFLLCLIRGVFWILLLLRCCVQVVFISLVVSEDFLFLNLPALL